MHKLFILVLFFNVTVCYPQSVLEADKPFITGDLGMLFSALEANRDSGFYKAIEILENGLNNAKTNYEIYRIAVNLGFLYTKTGQFDKCLDMFDAANRKGICFDFYPGNNPFPPYLSDYKENKRFAGFMIINDSLREVLSANTQAEYFVALPAGYDKSEKYPLLIVLHGGLGNYYGIYENWQSDLVRKSFITVYIQGRELKGSFTFSYGNNGMDDVTKVYHEVIEKYPADTTSVILAGQSAGAELALNLTNSRIPAKGLFLAFPVKPADFDIYRAQMLKKAAVKTYMIFGEQDRQFYPGQSELSNLLDSAKVKNRVIKYPDLGHDFPDDFDKQLDIGLTFLLEK